MRSWDTPAGVSLRLGVQRGRVEVETGDAPRTEVDVTTPGGEPVDPESVRIDTRELPDGGAEIVVEQRRRRSVLGAGAQLLVRVRCPHGADVDATTGSADVALSGRYGRVAVKTTSGDCVVGAAEGSVRLGTASGDCRVEEALGPISVSTASGDLFVGVAGGPLGASLVSGDVDVRDARSAVSVSTVSGTVDVEACGGGDVTVRTVSGDVRLGLRAGLALWLDVASVSGTLRSELETGAEPPGRGDHVVEVRVRTVSGDVTVTRAVALAAS